MLVLKIKQKVDISSNSYDKDTTTDDDSVEVMLPTVLNIVLANPQEKTDVYPLG